MLLAAGFIGVILLLCLLSPGAFAIAFPYPPVNGSDSTGSFSDSFDENGTALFLQPLSDDERLEALIARTGVPLLELAAGGIYSAYNGDDAALRDRATGICSLAGGARHDALTLEVSPEIAPAHTDFIAALDEYIAAGTLLGGSAPLNQSMVDEALDHLVLGTEHLLGAMQGCRSPDAGNPETEPVLMSHATELAPEFPDALQIGERFRYDDASGANSGSVVVFRIRTLSSFYTTGVKPQSYAAKSGESFLLVAIKATHLGHKGDSTNYRLQAPRESAFILYYAGETYRPIPPPGPTNQGEAYSGRLLERHESVDGYLFFEVPEDFDPLHAYIEASIGRASPVWYLGDGVAAW